MRSDASRERRVWGVRGYCEREVGAELGEETREMHHQQLTALFNSPNQRSPTTTQVTPCKFISPFSLFHCRMPPPNLSPAVSLDSLQKGIASSRRNAKEHVMGTTRD